MRLVNLFLFILLSVSKLQSYQAEDYCYSIQVGSFNNASLNDIKKLSFPKSCQIIKQKNRYVIKCECDTEKNIRKRLINYQKSIPGSFLTKTEKRFFKKMGNRDKKNIKTTQKSSYRKPYKPKKQAKKSETLTELMYKVFIYNNDLKNAKKVAYSALKRDPKNLMWRKYLADVLSANGQSKEAFKHYMYIYNKTKTKKTLNLKVEGYGTYDKYFMLLGKIFSNPKDQKSIEKFVKTAEKLGNSKEALSTLDKLYNQTKSVNALKMSANLHLILGNKKEAIKRFKILEKAKLLDLKTAMTLSRIFFGEKKFHESLNSLLSVKHLAKRKDKEYWSLLVDVYAYLKEDEKAAKLLRALCSTSTCKKGEYDKLISFYSDKDRDKDFALQISLKAFQELRDSSYFFSLSKMSLEKKDTQTPLNIINSFTQEESREYRKLPLFWLIIASLNNQLGDTKKAISSYKKALMLDPNSLEILTQYSWFLLSKNQAKELKTVISLIQNRVKREKKLYILAAAINYKLNNIQNAYKYYIKAIESEPKNIDLKLDFANLLIAMGRKEYANKITKEVYQNLQYKMKQKPELLKEKQFLKQYLRSSIYFIPAPNYQQVMNYAKNILDKETYINLDIAWKLYTKDDEYVAYLSKQLKEPELWLKSYLTMRSNNKYAMQDLLYHYGAILPIEDKINMELKTKQIGLARRDTFIALQKNPQSQSLYQTKYNIDTEYGNKINSEVGYENQGDLKRSYIKIKNLQHISDRYYLGSSLEYAKNSANNIILSKEERDETTASLWLKMLMNDGYMEAGGAYTDGFTKRPKYFFNLYSKLNNRLNIKLELEKNKIANESVPLRLRGQKDYSSLGIRYQFDKRLSIQAQASASSYKLQKGTTLGSSQRYNIEMQQKIKFSYPDILFREYLTIADFTDKGMKYLPDDYIEGGVGVHIGMSALNRYSSNWKPYADLSTTYNNGFGLSFSGQIGMSGRFIGDDYLNLSLNYSSSSSSDEELWLMKLTHSYLY